MKTTQTQVRFRNYCVIGGLFGLAVTVLAQSYSVDWFTLDGGGGTSTGGVYAVSGSIGQPDTGPAMTNGQYSVVGGFWSVAAVQTPGAPLLSLARTSTNTVVLWWPLPDTGWQLQAATNLNQGSGGWTTRPPPYATNATSFYFVEPVPRGNQFYRLHRP
jgi:hypothetical protein